MKEIYVACLGFVFLQVSCKRDEEKYFVQKFEEKQEVLDSCIRYIQNKYIDTLYKFNFNRKTIVKCGNPEKFKDDDYRVCDSVLKPKMKETEVDIISIEKDVCTDDRQFDLIIFNLDSRTSESYHYYYSFCNAYNEYTNTSTVKNVPLKENWSLFVEKK